MLRGGRPCLAQISESEAGEKRPNLQVNELTDSWEFTPVKGHTEETRNKCEEINYKKFTERENFDFTNYTPLKIYLKLLNNIFDHITIGTNFRLSKNKKDITSKEEIIDFLIITIYMGLKPNNRLQDYWLDCKIFGDNFVPLIFKRDRYRVIHFPIFNFVKILNNHQ